MSQRHSQRSGHSLAPYEPPIPVRKERSKCTTVLCMSWKFFTCVFSHVMLVALVVSYCILGAYTFQRLEGENEIMVSVMFCPIVPFLLLDPLFPDVVIV